MTSGLRSAVASLGAGFTIERIETMREVVTAQQTTDRFGMFLFGAFAAIALLLAGVSWSVRRHADDGAKRDGHMNPETGASL